MILHEVTLTFSQEMKTSVCPQTSSKITGFVKWCYYNQEDMLIID